MAQRDKGGRYSITQNDAEMARLMSFAQAADGHARDGLGRVGVGRGWKAIDVGCGPVGALLTLADLCGPEGAVLGLDMDKLSLQRARGILDHQGLEWVQLV